MGSLWVHLHNSNPSLLGCWHRLRLLRDPSELVPFLMTSSLSVDPLCCEFRVTGHETQGYPMCLLAVRDRLEEEGGSLLDTGEEVVVHGGGHAQASVQG